MISQKILNEIINHTIRLYVCIVHWKQHSLYERSEMYTWKRFCLMCYSKYIVSADWEPLTYVTVTSMLMPMHFNNCFYITYTVCFTILKSFYCKYYAKKRNRKIQEGKSHKSKVSKMLENFIFFKLNININFIKYNLNSIIFIRYKIMQYIEQFPYF